MNIFDIITNAFSPKKPVSPLSERQVVAMMNKQPLPTPASKQPVTPSPTVNSITQSQLNLAKAPGTDFVFNYDPYVAHMEKKPNIAQPNAQYAEILREVYPEDATRAALTSWAEGALNNPKSSYFNDTGSLAGTRDVGAFQLNSGTPYDPTKISTIDDLLRRKPKQMRATGYDSNSDLTNPEINARIAKINRDEAGGWYGRWFGLRNKGFREQDFQGLVSPY